MKFKTTTKQVKNGCVNIKYAGYCDLQFLLRNHEPTAYTCGVYGWNYDIYEIYGVTICTGYRGMPGTRLEQISEYEKMARDIWDNYKTPYEERQNAVESLLKAFCKLNGGHIYD